MSPLPDMITDVEHEHEAMTFVALLFVACFGGVVKWCRNSGHKKRTILSFITSVATAGFVGLQAHFLMTWMDIDMSLQFAISGAAGYSGGVLLDAILPFAWKLIFEKLGLVKQEPVDQEHTDHDK